MSLHIRIVLDKANLLAEQLARKNIDENELSKILAYFSACGSFEKTKSMVNTFLNDSDHFLRSGRTKGYYRDIRDTIANFNYATKDENEIRQILEWARRLVKWYKNPS